MQDVVSAVPRVSGRVGANDAAAASLRKQAARLDQLVGRLCTNVVQMKCALASSEVFLKILEKALNNPLNLPLRKVRQLLKATGGAARSTQNATANH